MSDMRNCPDCGGPTAQCVACHHYHCDDDQCIGFPIDCASGVQVF